MIALAPAKPNYPRAVYRGSTTLMAKGSDKPNHALTHLLRPYAKSLTVAVLALTLEGAAGLAEPWPLKIVLDNVLKSKPARGWLSDLVLSIAGADKLSLLKWVALASVVIASLGAACTYVEKYLTITVGHHVAHNLRQALYSHIQRLSLGYHDKGRTGDLISRLTSDIDAIQTFIASGLLGVLINGLTLLGMIVIMLFLNWHFTLVALSVVPLLFIVVFRYTLRIKKASREVRRKEDDMVSVIQEALSSIHVIKAFAREDHEQQRLAKQSLASVEIALQVRNLKVKLSPIVDLIIAISTCLVLWFGGRMALKGMLSAGSLMLFIWYLGRMYKPMRDLSKMTDAYSRAAVGYERIREVLKTDREVKDLPSARTAPRFSGEIELSNVSFAYEPNYPILKQISLVVKPGQVAALIGPTGAGKSTIINLISRFYDPDAGTVKIDGIDVKLYRQRSLRRQISFVLQETQLFRESVWYNIAYGKPDASSAEVMRAARVANACEFIERMPEGFDTVIGERGVTLSGGQRQRIAIARAVIRDTPILILDEVSSGLDAVSEKLVLEALGRLMKGKTSIVIAHRLSTIRSADVIFFVESGRILEHGNHEELLRKRGFYAMLHRLQSGAEDDSIEPSMQFLENLDKTR